MGQVMGIVGGVRSTMLRMIVDLMPLSSTGAVAAKSSAVLGAFAF